MALSNYTELKASIASYLHRTDLTATIPDFIALAESRINGIVHMRAMELEAALSLPIGERRIALPAAYSSPLAVWLTTDQPRAKLTPLVAEQMPVSNVAGAPNYWCIDGGYLAFERAADRAHSVSFRYVSKFKLTDGAPTNALLTNFPNVYLYAALLESAPFLGHDERFAVWQSLLGQAIKEVNNNEQRGRAVGVMSTDVPRSMVGSIRRY